MEVFLVGLNHRSAPLHIRERLAFPSETMEEFLQSAGRLPHVEEVLAVSTCNRVEIYGASQHPNQAKQQILRHLAEYHRVELAVVEAHAYFFRAEAALNHCFRVASSLDSLIVGEPQVLGQMKDAYRLALESGTTGRMLNKFFHRAFNVAKKVRSETGIASQPVSISYAAVTLAKQIFGDLSKKKALILGAGKMSGLAIKHLKNSGIQQMYLANRTAEKAEQLAHRFGLEPIPFANFERWLPDADVVMTSTNSPEYLIDREMVEKAMRSRKNSPIFFIDIAVPRDVSPEVNEIRNVFLYDVDDLGAVVAANKKERNREAEYAGQILEKEVKQFAKELQSLQVVPTISSLSKKFDQICQQELEKAFIKLPQLDAEGREVIETMASSIVKKVLHDPLVTLKEKPAEQSHEDFATLVRKLFRLDEI